MINNEITKLFGIKYGIISGGMVWCSSWRLAAAVSNCGGLGLIGAGSMHLETLKEHIIKCKEATNKPFGVNLPLLYPQVNEVVDMIIEQKVPIVFTAAGSPAVYTQKFKEHGIKVAHVVSSSKFALKAESAGCDAVVCEGFEAGGHNGREESTTLVLLQAVKKSVKIPVIAAGGIGGGDAIVAAMALGAQGVQIGTLFALSEESSASEAYKQKGIELKEGDTFACLKKMVLTRMAKNTLVNKIIEAENRGAEREELLEIIGDKGSKRGIFEGDIENGKLEIGEIAAIIESIDNVETIFERLISEYKSTIQSLR
ncbi:MAG: nitronate monooxygenase [Rikenellaceae bacterium]